MVHVVTIQGFIGLISTDDPLKVKKYQFFHVFYFDNDLQTNKNVPLGDNLNIEKEEPSGRGLLYCKEITSLFSDLI